jgi:DNA-binding transcriptional LysR family regulator
MLHSRMLRYLDEVARCGSIRQAAERLNVASSAINRQILALEAELGTPIFQRLPRKLRLTATGELVIGHVRETLKEHRRVQSRIHDLKGLGAGEVTLATMNGLAGGLLPRLAAEFAERHPRAKIAIRSLFVDEIVHAVVSGEADVGLAYNLPADPRLRLVATFDTRLGAVVAPTHPLALRSPVRLSECAAYPIILADASMTVHQIMTAAFARADLVIEPAFRSNSIEFMKTLARREKGVTFLSNVDVAEEQATGSLVYLPIQDRHVSTQPLILVQRAKRTLDATASLFMADITDALRELVVSSYRKSAINHR